MARSYFKSCFIVIQVITVLCMAIYQTSYGKAAEPNSNSADIAKLKDEVEKLQSDAEKLSKELSGVKTDVKNALDGLKTETSELHKEIGKIPRFDCSHVVFEPKNIRNDNQMHAFVVTDSLGPCVVSLTGNNSFTGITNVYAYPETHQGQKGIHVIFCLVPPHPAKGGIGLNLIQAGITGDCVVIPM